MSAKLIFQTKSLRILASLTLAAGLLALSLVLMVSLAQARLTDDGGAVTDIDSDLGGGGPSWMPIGGPIASGGQATALAVHPNVSGTFYAAVGTPNSGSNTRIYTSTDGAASWTPVYTATADQLNALAVTGTGTLIYAAGQGSYGQDIIVKSGDGGASWTGVFTGDQDYMNTFNALAINPVNTTTVYAAGQDWWHVGQTNLGVVYRSQDGGANWTRVLTVPQGCCGVSFYALAINPVTPTTVYAAGFESTDLSYGAIYSTNDGGDTWNQVYSGTHPSFASLVVHPLTPTTVYAGSYPWGESGYVFRSEDSGVNWTKVLTGAGMALAFDAPDTIYAVAQSGSVYTSAVGGDPGSWGPGSPGFGYSGPFVSDEGTLYAGGWSQGVWKSTNDGATWEPRNNGIQSLLQPEDIDVDPQSLDALFVATGSGGGWRSRDGGENWTQLSGISGHMRAFAINPEDPDIVYGGGSDSTYGAVMRSEDGGDNWTRVYTSPVIISGGNESIYVLAIAPSMSSTVYAAGDDWRPTPPPQFGEGYAVVLRSLDDGKNWTEVFTRSNASVEALAINPISSTVVYAAGYEAGGGFSGRAVRGGPPPGTPFVYRTTDGGTNWTKVFTPSCTVRSIVIDYQKPNVLYAADDCYNVYKSTDGGDHWTIVRDPSEGGSGNHLAIDPHVPSHVYVGAQGYIGETPDGGQTWSDASDPLNQGYPQMELRALTVDTGTPTQTLYAGFSGVWYYRRWAPQEGPRYVATTGSDDANLCVDPAAPCRTIGHALDLVSSGESVLVAEGTYVENLTIGGKTLTLRGGYTISGTQWLTDTGETVVDGNSADRTFLIHGNDSVLENLTITGGDTPDGECWGGGVWVTDGDVTIRSSTITGNWADCSGGGVEVNSDWGPAHLTLEDSIVVDNGSGGEAGGVSVWHTGAHLTNTLVVSNTAGNASALRIEDSDVTIQNCTIADNQGGSAINAYDTDGQPDVLTVRNGIVWGNTDANLACTVQTCTVTYSDIEGGWTDTGNINEDPLFVGGGDYHLQPDSPCVDTGTNTGAPDHDFEGDARPFAYGVDMGADEWWPMLSVTLSTDQAGEGPPGTDVTYVFTVTNDGDYTDTFGLEVSGVWTPTLDTGITGPLASGGSSTVALTVTIPPDAVNGTSDVATLTATSGWSTAVSDSALATTTARWHKVYLPITLRNFGP